MHSATLLLTTDDEAEDGALEDAEYAVGEEEVMPDANPSAEQEAALQRDLEANGSAQPDSAEDDRYVAVAYSEGEDQDDRSVAETPLPAFPERLPCAALPDAQLTPTLSRCKVAYCS